MSNYSLTTLARIGVVVSLFGSLTAFFVCGETVSAKGGADFVVNTTSDAIVPDACVNGLSGCSLRGAITAANADPDANTIDISIPAEGNQCSFGACLISLNTALPTISTPMSIIGPGADQLSIHRNSSSFFSVFDISNANSVTIAGMTIRGGSTPGSGAGIRNASGTVNVSYCHVSNNSAVMGGAGGGVFNGGTMVIYGSSIINNTAPNGSAGGIRNQGILTIVNSTIRGNSAPAGGAILSDNTLSITNSTITGNTAVNWAGGVQNGISNTATVKSSIIAGNNAPFGPDVLDAFISAGFNFIGKTDGSSGFTSPTDQTGTIASPLDASLGPLQDNGGPTFTMAPRPGSPVIDKGTSAGLNGDLTSDQRGAAFPRTNDEPAIPNADGGDGTDIGAVENDLLPPRSPIFDFDGDGKTDVSIFRPSNGQWWFSRSSDGSNYALTFGLSTDEIVPADYTGDGITDVAIYRPSTGEWYILRSEDFSYYAFPFGIGDDTPVPADYDGDGKADPAVFRPSTGTWYILKSTDGLSIHSFGLPGDKPIVADYDGDGKADLAVRRVFQWWILRSSDGVISPSVQPVISQDISVQGDYSGDGKADVAFFTTMNPHYSWRFVRSEDLVPVEILFGQSGDMPVPGDYDGDGKMDLAFFRPSTNTWHVRRSSDGVIFEQTFGTAGDLPLPNAFLR